MMTADGKRAGDGSWTLNIYITDLDVEQSLRVTGDLHVGGVMLKLVEKLGKKKMMRILRFFCFSIRT